MMQSPSSHLFIFAGEASGDLHGSKLMHALQAILPQHAIAGVGGPAMRAQGMHSILQMEDFEVMGFSDVLWALPRLRKQFYRIRDYILRTKPQAVILIDYPGFNLRLANALRSEGFIGKIIQYVCPSVWAWGKKRIPHMARTLDLLLTIYPFEAASFSHTTLQVQYVGNPLQEIIHNHSYDTTWSAQCGITDTNRLLALFPGSRTAEIQRNLPKQLQAVHLLQAHQPHLPIAISYASARHLMQIQKILQKSSLCNYRHVHFVPKHHTYELMRTCHTAIAKSGTVTLELALHGRPTVVVYALSFLNRIVAKHIFRIRLPNYCIVNILHNKRLFPELIATRFTSQNLYHSVRELNQEGAMREQCLVGCQELQTLLSQTNASQRAAQAIKGVLECDNPLG